MTDFDPFAEPMDDEPSGRSLEDAVDLLRRQAALVQAIATEGPPIKQVDPQYQDRRRRIRRSLEGTGLGDPLPWTSLWEARSALTTVSGKWRDRRVEVERLIAPVIEELERRIEATPLEDDGEGVEPSWADVDERLADMKTELARATSLDDYQDVGRRCREIVTAAVNMVFADDCVPGGEAIPSSADAKARLNHYLAANFGGSDHDEIRAFLRKLLALANAVTHDARAASFTGFAVAQGTISFMRIVQEAQRAVAARLEF